MIDGKRNRAWIVALPALGWIILFLIVPLVCLLFVSALSRGSYGEILQPWTAENYQRLAGFGLLGFDSVYPKILARSLWMGCFTTVCCVMAALPAAFFIARLPRRFQETALIIAVIPFWTNLLIRTYGWQIILGEGGLLTNLLRKVPGLGDMAALAPGPVAVYLCLICDYLPFMLLPVYASVSKLDGSLVEAARDLGASRFRTFRHGIWPQIVPGVMAGTVMVFLPATGQFVIPDLLGGARTIMLGNLLQQQFGAARDWPFGAAIGMLFLLLMIVFWVLFRRQLPKWLAAAHRA